MKAKADAEAAKLEAERKAQQVSQCSIVNATFFHRHCHDEEEDDNGGGGGDNDDDGAGGRDDGTPFHVFVVARQCIVLVFPTFASSPTFSSIVVKNLTLHATMTCVQVETELQAAKAQQAAQTRALVEEKARVAKTEAELSALQQQHEQQVRTGRAGECLEQHLLNQSFV